jgi:hypothetical protein
VTNATNLPYGSFFVVALSRRLWFLVGVDRSRGESRIVTAEAVSSAPVGEAGFRVGLASDELAISEPCGSGSRPWAGGSG